MEGLSSLWSVPIYLSYQITNKRVYLFKIGCNGTLCLIALLYSHEHMSILEYILKDMYAYMNEIYTFFRDSHGYDFSSHVHSLFSSIDVYK